MATEIGRGVIPVGFDPEQARRAGEEQLGPAFTGIAQNLAGAISGAFATLKIKDFIGGGIDELKASVGVTAQSEQQLKNLGSTAGITLDQIDALSHAMLDQSGVDDELAKRAANTALRLGVQGDAVRRVVQDANDLSQSYGDITSDNELLAKALAKPEQAARLLKPAIGGLTDAQLESIKTFQAQGNEAAAQGVILDAVEAKVRGAAVAFGETLPGQTAKATESWKNAKAELVGGLAPAMEFTAKGTQLLAAGIDALPSGAQAALGGVVLLAGGVAAVSSTVANSVVVLDKLRVLHLANAGASEVDAVATIQAATAQAGLATNSSAAVASLYAEDAALAGSSAAFGAWGIVAAAAIISVSTALDVLGSKEEHDFSGKLQERLGQTGQALAEQFDFLRLEGNREDTGKFLEGFEKAGTAGLGALIRMRDAMKQMGQDTTLVDAAIASATTSQQNYTAAVNAGTSAITGTDSALAQLEQTRTSEIDLLRSAFTAEDRYESATRSVQDALRGREQATERVTDAQKALNEALKPAGEEDLGKADLDIESAKLRVGDAAKGVRDAEAEVNKERKDGKHTADDVADAERKVEEAKIAYQQAVYGVTDAEGRLQELQKKGTDQDPAVISARQNLATAQDGIRTATDRVTQALKDQADADVAVQDANYKLLNGGVLPANVALEHQLNIYSALAGQLDPSNPFRQNLDAFIGQMGGLAALFAGEPGPGGVIGPGLDVTPPGYIPKYSNRAMGGPVQPYEMFNAAEQGRPEILWPGLYQAPSRGGYVSNAVESEQWLKDMWGGGKAGGGVDARHTGNIIINNPAPEPASTSIGHEHQIREDRARLIS